MDTELCTYVQRMLGIDDIAAYFDIWGSGPSGLAGALAGVMAVASGTCETALVYRSVRREWGQQSGKEPAPASGPAQFHLPYGDAGGIIPVIAMKKLRRFAEFGTTDEDHGWLAVNARRWSALNPRAVLQDPITMDDYLASRYIAEPLHLLDCDYPVTGACATVITKAERAADLPHRPVLVDAMAFGTGANPDWTFADDFLFGGTIACSKRLWSRASVGPSDVDVVQLYDGFTHITMSWVEALGLCGIGEFGDWVEKGERISSAPCRSPVSRRQPKPIRSACISRSRSARRSARASSSATTASRLCRVSGAHCTLTMARKAPAQGGVAARLARHLHRRLGGAQSGIGIGLEHNQDLRKLSEDG